MFKNFKMFRFSECLWLIRFKNFQAKLGSCGITASRRVLCSATMRDESIRWNAPGADEVRRLLKHSLQYMTERVDRFARVALLNLDYVVVVVVFVFIMILQLVQIHFWTRTNLGTA